MVSPQDRRAGKWPKTIGYFTAVATFGAIGAAWGPALPGLAAQTQSNLSQISVIFTASGLGFILGSSFGGRIYDRISGHPLMSGSLLIMSVIIALVPSITELWLLTLMILILGIAIGLMVVGANTLLVWVHRENVGPWMNALTLFNGFGALLSPIIITYVLTATGEFNRAFWILALFIFLPMGWLFFVRSPSVRKPASDDPSGHINHRLVIPVMFVFFLYLGSEMSFHSWFYSMMVTVHEGIEVTAGYMTSAFWGAVSIGRLFSIVLITRQSPRKLLFASFVSGLISIGIILIGYRFIPMLWIGVIGIGLSFSSIFPILLTFVEKRIMISGKISGLLFSAGSFGGMIFPWVGGQLFAILDPRAPMFVVLVGLLLAALIFLWITIRFQPSDEAVKQNI